jgi:phage-related minor tail protein
VAQLKASVASSLETFSPFINQVGNVAGSLESVMPSVRKLRRGIRSVGRFMKGFGDKMKVLSPIMRGLSLSQIRLNIAMIANPVGLIVMGIAALIALVTVVIVKYNEWGAALTLIMGPLGFVINLIQSFRRNWELITEAFSNDGIVAGLKMIGVTILDAILMPIQQVLELMSYLPFIGDLAGDGANSIKEFRKEIGANVEEENEEEVQQAKPSKKEVEEQEPIYVNPLSDSKTTNSNPTYGSGATASTKTSSTAGIASGGKKVINVRIERLIDNLNINTQNVKESTAEIKSLVTRAIMDSVRDAEVAI